jgi:cell division protein FtsI/penicillin-binding protein 2
MACVTDLYEMGSTIKPLAIAAALDSGKVKPGFSYYCQGKTKIGGRTIRCDLHAPFWNGHKKQDLSGIVAHSCNLGTAQCFLVSGAAVAKDYFERFGFTQLPGSEFRGERALKLPDPERWRPSELATRSYGHGIAVSPLHLITAYCALANGGFKVRPRLVLGQERSDGSFLPSRTVEQRTRILKPSTVRLVQSYLRAVVTEGTGQAAELVGYPAAGKTGTPQKLRSDGRGYVKGLVRAMFCGFAPADNPRVAVLVLYDEPQTSQYAAVVAAPVWRRVTQETLWRLKVPPSRGPEIKVARRRGD